MVWELPVLCNVLDELLESAAPLFTEFALPRVDMPIGNVLQKNDFSCRQLAGLETFALNRKPGMQGTFGRAAGGTGKSFMLSMEGRQFFRPSTPHAGRTVFTA